MEEDKEEEEKEEQDRGAVCRAGLLWITWSSAGLRIYSSTAAVRGSGVSCMLLPRITAKHGYRRSICWILDSAASEALRAPVGLNAHSLCSSGSQGERSHVCTKLGLVSPLRRCRS